MSVSAGSIIALFKNQTIKNQLPLFVCDSFTTSLLLQFLKLLG